MVNGYVRRTVNKSPGQHMKTTIERYNQLCDNKIINSANYDINKKVGLFVE